MGETRKAHTILFGNLQGKDHLENIVVDGWIILECI
jgi:hypothetical protein